MSIDESRRELAEEGNDSCTALVARVPLLFFGRRIIVARLPLTRAPNAA
jgi:hypothetical protein